MGLGCFMFQPQGTPGVDRGYPDVPEGLDACVAPFKEIIMSKKIIAALALSSVLVLGACNTVKGAGRDVQSAGKAVEKTAN